MPADALASHLSTRIPLVRSMCLQQAALVCVVPTAAAHPPDQLYFTPYVVPRWLPVLDLAGPFAGACPARSKPEGVGTHQLAIDAERLWQWAEAALQATL